MMARNKNVPFKGRIQKRKTHDLQIITFGLQRAAGPYRWVNSGPDGPELRLPIYPEQRTSSDRPDASVQCPKQDIWQRERQVYSATFSSLIVRKAR